MNQKREITEQVLNILRPNFPPELFEKAMKTWWASTRRKKQGGLKLTELGYTCLIQADLKDYIIKFENPIQITNQLHIWLDHFIDCPFYLTEKEIRVFSEKMAVQLVLFSGNIYKYGQARAKSS